MIDINQEHLIIDEASVLRIVDNDITILKELLEVVIEDLPTQVDALLEAVKAEDIDQTLRQAHRIKGESRECGSGRLSSLAGKIENAAREDKFSVCCELAKSIPFEFEQFDKALKGTDWEALCKKSKGNI